MPETARIADSVSGLSASIQMSKQAQSLGISGVADFVPVMAGAHVGSPSANAGQTHLSVNAQTFNAGSLAQASNLQGSNTQASIDQTSMMAGIAGRLGIESTRSLSDNRVQNIQLRVAGVDFDMTPSAFVQMLAKRGIGRVCRARVNQCQKCVVLWLCLTDEHPRRTPHDQIPAPCVYRCPDKGRDQKRTCRNRV